MLLKRVDRLLGLRNRLLGLPAGGFDLDGEKLLDWGWCTANLPRTRNQRILEVGCAQGVVVPSCFAMGHEVMGVDTDQLPYKLPGFTFFQADFLDLNLAARSFDVVVLCSVLEHIGLPGRYGQKDIPNGDLQSIRKAGGLLKTSGIMILTVPVGRDLVFAPWHRIYGQDRLHQLLSGFVVRKEQFMVKEPKGPWGVAERSIALQVDRGGLSYALGQFVLQLEGG